MKLLVRSTGTTIKSTTESSNPLYCLNKLNFYDSPRPSDWILVPSNCHLMTCPTTINIIIFCNTLIPWFCLKYMIQLWYYFVSRSQT